MWDKIERNMKLIYTACFALIILFFDLFGMKQQMPFRVGFEFQMSGALCSWAMSDYSLQKKPLFEAGIDGNRLFHVELDGPDIEFVTIPFSYLPGEKTKLERCMDFIVNMTEIMMKLSNNPDRKTTMLKWFDESSKIKGICLIKYQIFSIVEQLDIKKPTNDWLSVWQPQVTLQHPLRSSINLLDNLFSRTVVTSSINEANRS